MDGVIRGYDAELLSESNDWIKAANIGRYYQRIQGGIQPWIRGFRYDIQYREVPPGGSRAELHPEPADLIKPTAIGIVTHESKTEIGPGPNGPIKAA